MTATDELRRLLDERDEFYETSGNRTWWGRPIDAQTGKPINVFHNQAQPMGDDRLFVELQLATPEQAIAATLGNDGVGRTNDGVAECERESYGKDAEQRGRAEHGELESYVTLRRTTTRNTKRTVYGNPRPVCEVCGYGIGDKRWGYCPKCGARIVEVD